jgi:hypothetical protein
MPLSNSPDPRTGNLRAVQLLLGHKKIESTVRYLGIERRRTTPRKSRRCSGNIEPS